MIIATANERIWFARKPNNRQDRGGKIAQISQTFSTFMEKNLSFISAQSHAEKLMFPSIMESIMPIYNAHHPYLDTYLHRYGSLFWRLFVLIILTKFPSILSFVFDSNLFSWTWLTIILLLSFFLSTHTGRQFLSLGLRDLIYKT